jgi:hypothetical protein
MAGGRLWFRASTVSGEALRHDLRSSTRPKRRSLQVTALSMVAAEVTFWFYSIYFIKGHDDLDGSGLEVIAMVPITAVIVTFQSI